MNADVSGCCRSLRETLGVYTVADTAALSAALNGFPLSELHAVCFDRIELLRSSEPVDTANALLLSSPRADQVSFLLLALACCVNHAHWFVKHEARLLMRKAEALTSFQRFALLEMLEVRAQSMHLVLGELEVRTKQQTDASRVSQLKALVHSFQSACNKKPEEISAAEWQSFYALDFELVPRLVAARKVLLHHGTAFIHDGQLLPVVQHTYEVRLTEFLRQCKLRLELVSRTKTCYHAPQFATILQTLADVQRRVCPQAPCVAGRLTCTAQSLPVLIGQFAPLCVVRLAIKLRERGHLVDQERVTLRLFLCAANVPLDVAVEYWSTHVHEEKKVRAALALVYDKKYTCVGCTKIRAGGLCPFEDSNKTLLTWCADTMPSAAKDIEDIVANTQLATERCARFFRLRHARPGSTLDAPRNPAHYFTRAADGFE